MILMLYDMDFEFQRGLFFLTVCNRVALFILDFECFRQVESPSLSPGLTCSRQDMAEIFPMWSYAIIIYLYFHV